MAKGAGEQGARVFISYSRKDLEIAEPLRDVLRAEGFDAYLDLHDIAPGEDWQGRLGALIASAEKVVFLISPDSVASEICDWEVGEAERQGKSVLPVVVRETRPNAIPGRLRRLNFIFYRDDQERSEGLQKLVSAISTDLSWEREKTRVNDLAMTWDRAGRPRRLLTWREDALRTLEKWRDRHPATSPAPTEVQLAYISESRLRFSRRLRLVRAGLTAVALVTSVAAIVAVFQRQVAVRQTERAHANLEIASRANFAIVSSILDTFATAEGVTLRTRYALLNAAAASIEKSRGAGQDLEKLDLVEIVLHFAASQIFLEGRDLNGGQAAASKAEEIARRRLKAEPSDNQWQIHLVSALRFQAVFAQERGEIDRARNLISEAHQVLSPLVERNPPHPDHLAALATLQQTEFNWALFKGDLDEGLRLIAQVRATIAAAVASIEAAAPGQRAGIVTHVVGLRSIDARAVRNHAEVLLRMADADGARAVMEENSFIFSPFWEGGGYDKQGMLAIGAAFEVLSSVEIVRRDFSAADKAIDAATKYFRHVSVQDKESSLPRLRLGQMYSKGIRLAVSRADIVRAEVLLRDAVGFVFPFHQQRPFDLRAGMAAADLRHASGDFWVLKSQSERAKGSYRASLDTYRALAKSHPEYVELVAGQFWPLWKLATLVEPEESLRLGASAMGIISHMRTQKQKHLADEVIDAQLSAEFSLMGPGYQTLLQRSVDLLRRLEGSSDPEISGEARRVIALLKNASLLER